MSILAVLCLIFQKLSGHHVIPMSTSMLPSPKVLKMNSRNIRHYPEWIQDFFPLLHK